MHINERRYGRNNRCSCVGVVAALIIIGFLLVIPSILEGTTVFVVGDPVLYVMSSLTLYTPIVIGALVIKILWDSLKRGIPEDF